jgi:hypothetical protein
VCVLISKVYFKKAQRGATQSIQEVYMIPIIQRERRTQISYQKKKKKKRRRRRRRRKKE